MTNEHIAISLYAIGARDWSDFLDEIKQEETTDEALAILKLMLGHDGGLGTDNELNAMLLPYVEREISRRATNREGNG